MDIFALDYVVVPYSYFVVLKEVSDGFRRSAVNFLKQVLSRHPPVFGVEGPKLIHNLD